MPVSSALRDEYRRQMEALSHERQRREQMLSALAAQQAAPPSRNMADFMEQQSQQRIDSRQALGQRNLAQMEALIPPEQNYDAMIDRYRGDQTPMTSHQRRLLAAARRDRLLGLADQPPQPTIDQRYAELEEAGKWVPGRVVSPSGKSMILKGDVAPVKLKGIVRYSPEEKQAMNRQRALRTRDMKNRMLARRLGIDISKNRGEPTGAGLMAERGALQAEQTSRGRARGQAKRQAEARAVGERRSALARMAMLAGVPPRQRASLLARLEEVAAGREAANRQFGLQERGLSNKEEKSRRELEIKEQQLALQGRRLTAEEQARKDDLGFRRSTAASEESARNDANQLARDRLALEQEAADAAQRQGLISAAGEGGQQIAMQELTGGQAGVASPQRIESSIRVAKLEGGSLDEMRERMYAASGASPDNPEAAALIEQSLKDEFGDRYFPPGVGEHSSKIGYMLDEFPLMKYNPVRKLNPLYHLYKYLNRDEP